ncbi:MAG: mannan-binding lectin [Candidatus Eremiobacteraeota bacterium]|nr:mannan-binding lectin [Candidatus Eremiobacteraeota bacterium]
MLPSAALAQARTIAVEAGPIWNQMDAERKCPEVAKSNAGIWNGQWRTTVFGKMSVCEVRLSRSRAEIEAIEAGPIWNQIDAERKCPEVAKANGGIWNGQWRTTVFGKMSVCEVRFSRSRG